MGWIDGVFRKLRAIVGVAWRGAVAVAAWTWRAFARLMRTALYLGAAAALLMVVINLFHQTSRDVAYRALDPAAPLCAAGAGWRELADHGNDEALLVERAGADWSRKLRCAAQRHVVPAKDGGPALAYDLAFLEFQENGDPYLLCAQSQLEAGVCDGGLAGAAQPPRGQLEALIARLKESDKNFVVAFAHGWRHNAQIGDGNVANVRVYAAHAARFVADRCAAGDARFCDMRVTAVFIGWRGARLDETKFRARFAPVVRVLCGGGDCWAASLLGGLASYGATFSLFDRKPVSEAIAPAVYAALQAVERTIGLQRALRPQDLAPCEHAELLRDRTPADPDWCVATTDAGRAHQARMIVFGHSLGGNLLATAVQDQMLKRVEAHRPGRIVTEAGAQRVERADFVPAPVGNLVVLVNPAAEAAKWTQMQRAVWRRTAMSLADKARADQHALGHLFFRAEQRPALVSVTAARDWPPGGVRAIDCAPPAVQVAKSLDEGQSRASAEANAREQQQMMAEEKARRSRYIDYDSATYDLFPLFRWDFRPIANSLERYARRLGGAPDPCEEARPAWLVPRLLYELSMWLPLFPFMNTDVEQTRTIGHLDPPRGPLGAARDYYFSGRPFGTTHEARGWRFSGPQRKQTREDGPARETSVDYADIGGPEAACPRATDWLMEARRLRMAGQGSATFWDAILLPPERRPALRFQHGFDLAGLAAITRANDPFWNVRTLDNALAQHNGYMLSSFICAMQQLVLDDVAAVPSPAP